MAATAKIRVPLVRAFEQIWRAMGRPYVYVFPWQTPSGATYDPNVDAWLDGDGAVVTKTDAELTYYTVPALWGDDADEFAKLLGGSVQTGRIGVIAKAEHRSKFDGAMMVTPGALGGDRYTIQDLDNGPDSSVFMLASLTRRES